MREQIDEQRPRLISSASRGERIDVPEVTYEKGGLRGAETIIIRWRVILCGIRAFGPLSRARGGPKSDAC